MEGSSTGTGMSSVTDPVTEELVMSFLDMIQEEKAKGSREMKASWEIIASWVSRRSGLAVQPRHIGPMTKALAEAGIITIGGGGFGTVNTYETREKEMGTKNFWSQVDAFLMVWKHPSRKSMIITPGKTLS